MIFTQSQWQAFKQCSLPNAVAQFEQIKQTFMAGHVGKGTRPWFVLDFTSLLPQGSTMYGFEVELGFETHDAKTSMMNWLWDNTDYTTVDAEGCGNYPVEITFPPIVEEQLVNGNNQILEWLQYNASLGSRLRAHSNSVTSMQSRGGTVGTHTNISTAAFRAATGAMRDNVVSWLATGFYNLNVQQKMHLFGRQPYINEVARRRGGQSGSTTDGASRIEFKMFHTTLDIEQFKNYCTVSKRLAELIDMYLADHTSVNSWNSTTFFEYLTQDLPRRTVISGTNTQYPATLREGYAPSYVPAAPAVAA